MFFSLSVRLQLRLPKIVLHIIQYLARWNGHNLNSCVPLNINNRFCCRVFGFRLLGFIPSWDSGLGL